MSSKPVRTEAVESGNNHTGGEMRDALKALRDEFSQPNTGAQSGPTAWLPDQDIIELVKSGRANCHTYKAMWRSLKKEGLVPLGYEQFVNRMKIELGEEVA